MRNFLIFFVLVQSAVGYTDDSINLLVRTEPTSFVRRFCIELAKLPNDRIVNVTSFGWYKPYLSSAAVNACNVTDIQNSLPVSFEPKTILILHEHNCKMTEHAWNVESLFGPNIALMIISKRENTRYSLTYNVTAMPVTITTMIFNDKDFAKMNQIYSNISAVQLSIDYPPEVARKFRPATLLMFLLVFLVLLAGNFWAADEFKRLIEEKQIGSTSLGSNATLIPTIQPASSSSNAQIITKLNSVTSAESKDHREPAIIPMTYCLIAFIFCFAVGWLLLIFYFPKVMIYVLQVMFCIGGFSSVTSCFNRLSQFLPSIRRYHIPACKYKRPCVCQCGPLNMCTLVSMAIALTLVLVWYFYRFADWAWILQDILGAAICISVISIYRLGNMRVITLILLGFFIYDIFFVFITPYIPFFQPSNPNNVPSDTNSTTMIPPSGETTISPVTQKPTRAPSVMEQVALGIGTDGEIVPLLFALPMFLPEAEINPCEAVRKSMLGFGDVILPGLLLTFCKLFDIASANRWSIYHIQSMISYFIGLILTHVALILMNTAQPALLYLVPCILLSTIVTGLFRGELKELYTGNRIRLILENNQNTATSSLLQGFDNPQGPQINNSTIDNETG